MVIEWYDYQEQLIQFGYLIRKWSLLCRPLFKSRMVLLEVKPKDMLIHMWEKQSVSSVDREWVDLIITIMDWLGYGSEQRYQIIDCDEWFDKICKLSVQWFMIINVYTMKQREWGLEILPFASDVWFETSSIEWWWDERMRTWGLEGIGVPEAVIIEMDSTGW